MWPWNYQLITNNVTNMIIESSGCAGWNDVVWLECSLPATHK